MEDQKGGTTWSKRLLGAQALGIAIKLKKGWEHVWMGKMGEMNGKING